ncbi:MAG: hypothetical protein AMDU2_EPLC00016G0004 [Thermoplasmatales archaeon E-plasma]|jgi:cation transporter-like permease|uniref:hypothetical protein n=1 Tax=Thermoplasma volcanium TaxID=50339 RepID=UPI00038950BE|nr:hypothetical protein [Thermoplasma volcanium]EQB64381.1 MAG: hypothetical protein AMDU2_EPLC00016G0004 [Thermoplasmatales archaeon E-plasma]
MSLLVSVFLALVAAAIGAVVTYLYLDWEGHEDKKVKYSIMVFLIVLLVILFAMYENIVSAWVNNLFT